jgi:hypothetical protein
MRTVVPTGGKVTPALLLGWASAVCFDAELELVAWAFAVEAGDDDDPVLADDTAVPCVAESEAAPPAELELDDPPHAVSSSTSEPSPVATVHPLLRMYISLTAGPGFPGPLSDLPETQKLAMTSFDESLITCHLPSIPSPLVLNAPAPLSVYRG